ncbi:MAG: hypothetical protein ACRCSO_11070 [Sphingomonas sp.]
MLRNILGTLAGIAVAMLVMLAIEYLDGLLYPLPADIDLDDPVVTAGLIAAMPLPAKLIVVSAWLLGAFAGTWAALRITDWRWSAAIVTALVVIGGVMNFLALPHPVWMQVCAVLLPLAGRALGIALHRKPYPGEPLLG